MHKSNIMQVLVAEDKRRMADQLRQGLEEEATPLCWRATKRKSVVGQIGIRVRFPAA